MTSPLEALRPLVGVWIERASFGDDTIEGRASFEWLGGQEAFLVYRSEMAPPVPTSLSLISSDGSGDACLMRYHDSRGVYREYRTSIRDGEWRITRDDRAGQRDPRQDGPGFSQRFIGALARDGKSIDGRWERSNDGLTWEVDFPLTYTRIAR
ncbi:MAG: hypothetical protein M3R54_12845 [Chloroflexota bacterium]|nr:hypothetical protein [Chloroflexota bacterium]